MVRKCSGLRSCAVIANDTCSNPDSHGDMSPEGAFEQTLTLIKITTAQPEYLLPLHRTQDIVIRA